MQEIDFIDSIINLARYLHNGTDNPDETRSVLERSLYYAEAHGYVP